MEILVTKRFRILLAILATGDAACDNEENDEPPEEQAEFARGSGDDAAEGDSTGGIG
jgi:hypothetical protein